MEKVTSKEMIEMLEQLKHDVNADIERRKLAYIGKDGKDYYDIENYMMADREYINNIYANIKKSGYASYKGLDGHEYGTSEELERANKVYKDSMFPLKEKSFDTSGDLYKKR